MSVEEIPCRLAAAGENKNAFGFPSGERWLRSKNCMAALRVPKSHQPGLAKIIALDDEAMAEFYAALESTGPALVPQELATKLGAKVARISQDDLQRILRSLIGIHQVRGASFASVPEFAEEVCNAVEDARSETLKLPPERREIFKQRIAKLLGYESTLGTTSKALDVMTEHERILCGARVLTDVRSVFGNPVEKPAAAVIVHMLKLSYHQDGEHKDFYVALDSSDVCKLKEVLHRAGQKAKSLGAALAATGISVLDS